MMLARLRSVLAEKGSAVYATAPSATVRDAVREMNAKGVGALLVLEPVGRVVGIFTERDVLRRVVDEGRDPATTPVRAVMTREVVMVEPSLTVGEAMAIMTRLRVRHLPVVEDGTLYGMVSIGDLTRWLVSDQQEEIDRLVDYITGYVRDRSHPGQSAYPDSQPTPSKSPSNRCGSGGCTAKRLNGMSPQSRSGGGGGMHTSGYAGEQSDDGTTVGPAGATVAVAGPAHAAHSPRSFSRASCCAALMRSTYFTSGGYVASWARPSRTMRSLNSSPPIQT